MEIRLVTPESGDFRALAQMLDAYYFTLVGDIQYQYAEPNRPENMTTLLVAYDAEVAVGCGAWKDLGGEAAEIKRIFVLPEYRRRGLATAIIRVLEKNAVAAGKRKLILETAVDTTGSHQLYLSLDYKLRNYYGSPAGAENCLCFEKEITV